MNEYLISVEEIRKKQIIIKAINEENALNKIKKMYLKSDFKNFKNEKIFEINARILEEFKAKNTKKINVINN